MARVSSLQPSSFCHTHTAYAAVARDTTAAGAVNGIVDPASSVTALLRVKRCEREAMLPWSAGCPALGGLSGVLLVGVFRARAGGGTLELAGPNSDLAAHRRPSVLLPVVFTA